MNLQTLKFYIHTMPTLLISLWLAICASVGNPANENAVIQSYTPASVDTTVHHKKITTPEVINLFVSQTPDKEKAKVGETVVLGCQFQSSRGPSLNNLTVKWYKKDETGQRDIMVNNVTVLPNYTKAFIVGNLSEGDASLTILNVTTSDHGAYFCQVVLSSGKTVTGNGTKLRIHRAPGWLGIEESVGTIIGVVAAGVGGLVVLIVVLTPQLRKCFVCAKPTSQQA
uniref:Ig-like domain-containing protein n=1 Tax=Salvator merianae TaxID=96440 RepID=A0A8D0BDU0_SALMN